jgi:predicted RNase H-like HicB family nuclease
MPVNRALAFYLAQPYPYTVLPDAEAGGFVIVFPDLPGCMTQVEEASDIAPMADEIRRLWIETEYEIGHDIPLPRDTGEYSGKFVVRLPKSLHRTLAETAAREGVSLNAWVTTLLARGSATAPDDRRLVAEPARTANDAPTGGRPARSRSRSRPAPVHP